MDFSKCNEIHEYWFKATLKTNPEVAEIYRQIYPGIIVRGYHCPPVQQPYWNTIELSEFDIEKLFTMIDEPYDEIVNKLPKKVQKVLPILDSYTYVKTDGTNSDFVYLCNQLDMNLDEIVGNVIDRSKYVKYNGLDSIHDVFIAY